MRANKEVILAGGAIGSPAILMYSGVGPSDVLKAAGVPLRKFRIALLDFVLDSHL